MAKTTASASGTNRYRATPLRKNMGRNTMQMESVETSAGTAICAAPSRMDGIERRALPPETLDVFDGHGGVVHQDAHRQRQPAQGHDVDGLVQKAERDHRGENGKRNRHRDDQGAAPASQEDQDHEPGEAGGHDGLANHAADGRAHEDGLIGQRLHLQRRGQGGGDRGQQLAHAFHHRQRGGVPDLKDGEQRGAAAVLPHDIGLRREAVAHVADVADIDGRAVHHLDRKIVELLHRVGGWRSGPRRIRTGRSWRSRPE